jgi:hypothetical protein
VYVRYECDVRHAEGNAEACADFFHDEPLELATLNDSINRQSIAYLTILSFFILQKFSIGIKIKLWVLA